MDEPCAAGPPASRRRAWGTVRDAAIALVVAMVPIGAALVGPDGTEGRAPNWLDAVTSAAVFALVLTRRRWPLPVLVVSAGLTIAATFAGDRPEAFIAATVIAAYTVATRTKRRTAWSIGITTAVTLYAAVVIGERDWLGPALGGVAWIVMATALGDALRSRRAYVVAVEERAERAERTREEEARRRVAEERVRIARDLHDVVAHHIAVINVHTGLAGRTLRTRPEQAETSLEHARQAARTVLDELGTILAVLRQNGDAEAPTDPVPGLSRLGELLDSFAAAGLRVEHRQTGPARPLPAAVDQAAYRIVQEALTNARKHGAGATATLRVEYGPDVVLLDVVNPAGPAAEPVRTDGGGHGLIGMRERTLSAGGAFTAEPTDSGGFRVHAVLPAPTETGGAP